VIHCVRSLTCGALLRDDLDAIRAGARRLRRHKDLTRNWAAFQQDDKVTRPETRFKIQAIIWVVLLTGVNVLHYSSVTILDRHSVRAWAWVLLRRLNRDYPRATTTFGLVDDVVWSVCGSKKSVLSRFIKSSFLAQIIHCVRCLLRRALLRDDLNTVRVRGCRSRRHNNWTCNLAAFQENDEVIRIKTCIESQSIIWIAKLASVKVFDNFSITNVQGHLVRTWARVLYRSLNLDCSRATLFHSFVDDVVCSVCSSNKSVLSWVVKTSSDTQVIHCVSCLICGALLRDDLDTMRVGACRRRRHRNLTCNFAAFQKDDKVARTKTSIESQSIIWIALFASVKIFDNCSATNLQRHIVRAGARVLYWSFNCYFPIATIFCSLWLSFVDDVVRSVSSGKKCGFSRSIAAPFLTQILHCVRCLVCEALLWYHVDTSRARALWPWRHKNLTFNWAAFQ